MRARLGLLLPALLSCMDQHVVAGDEQSKAEQLIGALPSWCDEICEQLMGCESSDDCACADGVCDCSNPIGENCPDACWEAMSRWGQGSDECAAIGQRIRQCIDTAACDVLSNKVLCEASQAEEAACPRPGNPDGGDSGPNGGSLEPPSSFDSGLTPAPITCDGGASSGEAPPAEPGVAQILCEIEHIDCSDGHDRRVVCVTTSQGPTSCSCRLDEAVTGAFDPGGVCPTVSQQNIGCGWSLAQM